MADHDAVPILTDKPKKRKINGSKQDQAKKQKLSSHITGPDCKCKRLKCFETVKVENRASLIDSFNALPTKNAQVSGLFFFSFWIVIHKSKMTIGYTYRTRI